MELTSKQARHLRALAHHLDPVVLVGERGVTAAVVTKVDVELDYHELIKVRLASKDREERRSDIDRLVDETGAVLAQRIGKIAVLYRAREEDPEITLPQSA